MSELSFYAHQQKVTAALFMLMSFFTHNLHKHPGLVCWCARQLLPAGVFFCFFSLQKLLFRFYILKHHPIEIASPALPARRGQPGLAIQNWSSSRRTIETHPLGHFHTCSFTLKTHICFLQEQTWPLYWRVNNRPKEFKSNIYSSSFVIVTNGYWCFQAHCVCVWSWTVRL